MKTAMKTPKELISLLMESKSIDEVNELLRRNHHVFFNHPELVQMATSTKRRIRNNMVTAISYWGIETLN
jgi:hypothetical protein